MGRVEEEEGLIYGMLVDDADNTIPEEKLLVPDQKEQQESHMSRVSYHQACLHCFTLPSAIQLACRLVRVPKVFNVQRLVAPALQLLLGPVVILVCNCSMTA